MYSKPLTTFANYFGVFKFFVAALVAAFMLQSCGAKRNLVYLSDLSDTAIYRSQISNFAEPRIQTGDLLAISVSNIDPESSNLFNKGLLPLANPTQLSSNITVPDASGYLIDKAGNTTFPAIGKVPLAGLTLDEAVDKLTGIIGNIAKNPIVTVKFLNFKVTVLGEVSKPGVFNIPGSKINVLEALGLAGDMTIYGRREDVWIMREQGGSRTVSHINLNNKDVLQSPLFYLQQNDIVYVKPDKMKERQARTDTKTISIIVAAATVITVIISRIF